MRTEFAEYLATKDVVAEGSLLDAIVVDRRLEGGCGWQPAYATKLLEYRVLVSRVALGALVDSVVTIAAYGNDEIGATHGDRVIISASRVCEDGWRLWGDLIPADDLRNWSVREGRLDAVRGRGPLTSYDELEALLALHRARSALGQMDGTQAVGMLRITKVSVVGPRRVALECDSIGWAVGSLASMPRRVEWTNSFACSFPANAVGDTLALPLTRDGFGAVAALDFCPRGLLVTNGYVPQLGASVSSLARSFDQKRQRLHLRKRARRN